MDDLSLLRDWLIIGAGRSWTLVGSLPGAELVKEAKGPRGWLSAIKLKSY